MTPYFDAAAYALGATSPDETLRMERELRDDPQLRQEVDAYREVAALLALAVRRITPPLGLRQRVMRTAAGLRAR